MPKKKIKKNRKIVNRDGLIITENQDRRALFRKLYLEKYFNKFLSQFEFEGLSYQQIAYIMRKFWSRGTVACGMDKLDGELFFCPYAPGGKWNIYDYPIDIFFINVRGVSFIPMGPQKLDQDAVIGFIQKDRKGIYELIYPLVEKLVDIEMTIYVNLKAQKSPLVVGVSPEDEGKKEELIDQFNDDSPFLFVGLQDPALAKAFVSGATYNIDKLQMLAQQVDNDILTYIGINNLGVLEKKEHLTVNEVDANNEQIANSSNQFVECLTQFFDQVNKVFNKSIKVKLKEEENLIAQEEQDEQEEDE